MKLVRFFGMALVAITLCMVSCSGEDGADGTNGINGTDGVDGQNGANGQDGADGQDGANGVGFDELTRFGYLTMVMEGTRSDNVPFKDSTSFRFTAVEGSDIIDFNQLNITDQGEDTNYDFDIERFLSAPDDVFQETRLRFDLNVDNIGEENELINNSSMQITNYAVIGDDNSYFIVDDFYSVISFNADLDFSDINFDPETNRLTFQYSVSVNENANVTGNPLTISGSVDVIVLEELPINF